MTGLQSDLLTGYSRKVRPLENQDNALFIVMIYTLKSLNDFDVVNGRMTTMGLFHLAWTDEKMTWNPADYGNIQKVAFRESDVWAPIFFIANGADDMNTRTSRFGDISISFSSSGKAVYLLNGVMTTTCEPDITYYPYDVHMCSVTLTTQELASEIQATILDMKMEPDTKNNLLWKIVDFKYKNYEQKNISFIEISLMIQRRPSYLIFTIILPICLLNFVNLLAFILPADSGERVSFAITVLLTLSVYMTIMSDSIPNTSDPVSILTTSLMIKLIYSAMIVLTVVFILKIYHTDERKPIPLWVLRIIRSRNRVDNKDEFEKQEDRPTVDKMKDTQSIAQITYTTSFPTWRSVGQALDNVFFVVFTCVTVVEITYNLVRITHRIG
ncbi:acetylcholine receptor subunit alpha-like [Ylistrum balloti]|uniref:acetylcholine receptor subunit alpha-like n=1 Tax=Ylistrum balloti TaxID=509963 RepID=UPI002905BA12|nr:acetylcholine receptor subunit alpha-like [Ylistrum balloti]